MAIGTPVDLGHASGASVPSNAITTTAAVATGDLILVPYAGVGTGATCADTALNTYFFAPGGTGGGTTILSGVFFCPNAIAMATSSTITVTNGSTVRSGITAMKIAGMATNPLVVNDRGIYQAGSITIAATATSATKAYNALAQTTELAIECVGSLSTALGTFTPTSGFTAIGGNTSVCVLLPAYKITSVGTQLTMSNSWVNSASMRAGIFCFRGAVAANTARPDGLLTGVGT